MMKNGEVSLVGRILHGQGCLSCRACFAFDVAANGIMMMAGLLRCCGGDKAHGASGPRCYSQVRASLHEDGG